MLYEVITMLTLSVGISLPVWAGSRQLPLRREALARKAAEEAAELDPGGGIARLLGVLAGLAGSGSVAAIAVRNNFV